MQENHIILEDKACSKYQAKARQTLLITKSHQTSGVRGARKNPHNPYKRERETWVEPRHALGPSTGQKTLTLDTHTSSNFKHLRMRTLGVTPLSARILPSCMPIFQLGIA